LGVAKHIKRAGILGYARKGAPGRWSFF